MKLLLIIAVGLAGVAFILWMDVRPAANVDPKDPEVQRLRLFLDGRGLKWHLDTDDAFYCVSAYKPPYMDSDPHSYHIECAYSLKGAVNDMIADYTEDKPGYKESREHRIASGEPK